MPGQPPPQAVGCSRLLCSSTSPWQLLNELDDKPTDTSNDDSKKSKKEEDFELNHCRVPGPYNGTPDQPPLAKPVVGCIRLLCSSTVVISSLAGLMQPSTTS
jgi:hypothetical protein